jgi:uncharacterized protein YoxC
MTYSAVLEDLPPELQLPMLRILETVEARMRNELAVRREDFDALRNTVGDLAQAQQRTEQRVEELAQAQQRTEQRVEELAQAQQRTEQRVEELAQAQQRTEQRVDQLAQRVEELAQAQQRTEQRVEQLAQRVEELAQAQQRTEAILQNLILRVDHIDSRLARLETTQNAMRGRQLERDYADKASGYFGDILRRARAVNIYEIEDDLEQRLTPDEMKDVRRTDVLVRGRLRVQTELPEALLVIEVSGVIDPTDVERAERRALLFKKAGLVAIPTVAGEDITRSGHQAARDRSVVVVQNGSIEFWSEALSRAIDGVTVEP